MKKILLITILSFCFFQGYSDTYYFAWDGAGLSLRNNYNFGQSWGTYQYKGVANGLGIGFMEINQQFSLNYDNEKNTSIGGNIGYNTTYYFVAPMVVFQLNKSGSTQCYVTGGVGEFNGGISTLNKWSRKSWAPCGKFDSSIDESTNFNPYVLRAGFGFTEFYHLGGNFHLFFNQDFGFLVSPIMASDNNTQALRGNMNQFFEPSYFSLRVGIVLITHSRDSDTPYRIYK